MALPESAPLRRMNRGTTVLAVEMGRATTGGPYRFQIGPETATSNPNSGLSSVRDTITKSYPAAAFTRLKPSVTYKIAATSLQQQGDDLVPRTPWSFGQWQMLPELQDRGSVWDRALDSAERTQQTLMGQWVLLDGVRVRAIVGGVEPALFSTVNGIPVVTERGLAVRVRLLDSQGNMLLEELPRAWDSRTGLFPDPSYVGIGNDLYRVTRRSWQGEQDLLLVCNPAAHLDDVEEPDWWTL